MAVRNDDDHSLNHGLVHAHGARFALAKAYDIVPSLQKMRVHHHALLIGDSAAGTVENLVENSSAFALSRYDALEIVREIEQKVLENWLDVFYKAGFGDEDMRKVEHVFRPIPEYDSEKNPGLG